METMRNRYQERLSSIEGEWRTDVKRIQDLYTTANQQMCEEHQNEIRRLEERLSCDDENRLQYSSDILRKQNKSVGELLAKWEQSAYKIEQLQSSVVARQEDLIRQQAISDNDNLSNKRLADIENYYKTFIVDLEQQRVLFEQTIKFEQEKTLTDGQLKIQQQNECLNVEKMELENLRQKFAGEVNEWRQKECIEAEKLQKKREKLREDVLIFEQRRTMLETVYSERNKINEEEQSRLARLSDEVNKKQSELDQKEIELNRNMIELQTEQRELQNRKQQFDSEKELLAQLGQTLTDKAEELEKLSEIALKEKLDGMQTVDEMDSFREEIKTKMSEIEKAALQINNEKQRLLFERGQLDQQWSMLKELKESIVCNLCGTALNKGKFAIYQNLCHFNILTLKQPNIETTILLWK